MKTRTALIVLPVIAAFALTGCGSKEATPAQAAPDLVAPTEGFEIIDDSDLADEMVNDGTESGTDAAGGADGEGVTELGGGSVDGVINIDIIAGEVFVDSARINVKLGEEVQLLVYSDEDDSIHVHGYEIEEELPSEEEVLIEFTADTPGTFEIETHENQQRLLILQVQ